MSAKAARPLQLGPKEMLVAAAKRGESDTKKQVSVKVEQRHLLYLNDLKVSFQRFVGLSLAQFLEGNGIDTSRPHDLEIWSQADPNDPQGKPITWGEARRQRLVDEKDAPAPGGAAEEETLQ